MPVPNGSREEGVLIYFCLLERFGKHKEPTENLDVDGVQHFQVRRSSRPINNNLILNVLKNDTGSGELS